MGRIATEEVVVRPPGGVRPVAVAAGGAATEAPVHERQASIDARTGDDPAGLGDGDVGAGYRAVVPDRRVARAQGHPRFQRAACALGFRLSGGRPRTTTPEQRDRIVAVARTRPDQSRRRTDPLVDFRQARRAPGRDRRRDALGERVAGAAGRRRPVVSAHPLVEVEPGSRFRREGRADLRSIATHHPTGRWSASTRWARSS